MRTTPNWTKPSPSHMHGQHLFSLSTWSRWRTHLANDFYSLPMSVNCAVQANYHIGQLTCTTAAQIQTLRLINWAYFWWGKLKNPRKTQAWGEDGNSTQKYPNLNHGSSCFEATALTTAHHFFLFFLNTISRWDKQERTVSYPGDVIVGYVLVNQITLTRLTELALKLQ